MISVPMYVAWRVMGGVGVRLGAIYITISTRATTDTRGRTLYVADEVAIGTTAIVVHKLAVRLLSGDFTHILTLLKVMYRMFSSSLYHSQWLLQEELVVERIDTTKSASDH